MMQMAGCCMSIQQANHDRLNAGEDRRRLSWGGVALGVVGLGIGGYLLLTADDPHKYDRAPADKSAAAASVTPLAWFGERSGGLLIQGRF